MRLLSIISESIHENVLYINAINLSHGSTWMWKQHDSGAQLFRKKGNLRMCFSVVYTKSVVYSAAHNSTKLIQKHNILTRILLFIMRCACFWWCKVNANAPGFNRIKWVWNQTIALRPQQTCPMWKTPLRQPTNCLITVVRKWFNIKEVTFQ